MSDPIREALEHVGSLHGKQQWRPNREWPSEYARGWHDGNITAYARVSIEARKALDPESHEQGQRDWRDSTMMTDSEWYAKTGHCGGCGTVADSCECKGKCGCWHDHGAPPEPYESPLQRAARQRDEVIEFVRRLDLLAECPECQCPQMRIIDLGGTLDEQPCGLCDVCRLRAYVEGA